MAGGPRKFSEKIALLNQKEAEGNAAFASIMGEVKSIRPSGSNSGSQLDMLDASNDCITDKNHSTIEETIRFNENINVTYMNERHHQQQQQFQLQLHKKHLEQQNLHKTDHQHPQQQFVMNNSFLQLPNQNDSFRRAHSDSSLNQTVANASQMNMNFNQDSNYQHQHHQQQQQQSQVLPHLQHQQQQQQLAQQYQQPIQFAPQFQNQIYQQSLYHQTSQQAPQQQQQQQQTQPPQQQQPPHLPFIQGSNEYNAIPFRNLSLPISQMTQQQQPQSPTNNFHINLTSPTSANSNSKQEPKSKSLTSPTKSNAASPTSALSPSLISPHHALNKEPNNNLSPSYIQQPQTSNQFIYPTNLPQQQQANLKYQQQQQQFQQPQNSDHLLSPTTNTNFLNANIQNTAGGSLPDLTSFQFQNNQSHQTLQLQEYNNKRQLQQHHQQHQHHQPLHQDQVYDFSAQMLQPNFQQHNHIGPVKPTHSSSVSPVRGASRYSPTHSNSNVNSISHRRASPQHLGLNKQLISNTSAQSSPTSPQHPSVQSFPALEFTISSYMPSSPNVLSNAPQQQQAAQTNGCIQNNIIYRTNSASTCTTGAESLPPSPQSQHSCFNSPQGSPGPISISPQDLNPFTSNNNINGNTNQNNNYDIMQKKFDSINLDTCNSFKGYAGGTGGGGTMYGQYSPVSALSPTSPTGPSQGIGLVLSPRSPTSPVNNNMGLPNNMHAKNMMKSGMNNGVTSMETSLNPTKTIDNTNDNLLINNTNTSVTSPIINTALTNDTNSKDKLANSMNGKLDLDEMSARNKLLMNNNGNNNNMLTNETGLVDLEQINYNHLMQQQQQHHHTSHMLQHSNNDLLNGIKTNPDNNSLINKTHKNSIPNIIFTFSGDSIDDKNDNILKDMSHDSMYNDDLLINKNEPINDLDLQMLSDGINDSENTNSCISIYQNT